MTNLKNVLMWFRNDLRVHDNEALHRAVQQAKKESSQLLTIYCFDPRQYALSRIGRFPKTGKLRTRFILQSVHNLRENLMDKGLNVMVKVGKPELIIPDLIDQYAIGSVHAHKEVTQEETDVERNLERELKRRKVSVKYYWGHTMIHKEDLPFQCVDEVPDVFTTFRNRVEKRLKVRECFQIDEQAVKGKCMQKVEDWGQIPSFKELGFETEEEQCMDERSALQFIGGETEALKRLSEYFWKNDHLKTYKETRNGLVGESYSSKFSPWLAVGCLSPRFVYHEVQKYEKERVKNESTYWLIFELLWRDFFRFFAEKCGNNIFMLSGISDSYSDRKWSQDMKLFEAWKLGETGHPFVDANMRELLHSGWMSNRGRQNVASYLAKDLQIDWRLGAEWFESQLIDYDVTSNWLNWLYTAGVGNDPRGASRYFNVVKQAYDYDYNGDFVKLWCPELAHVPQKYIHMPYKMSYSEQQSAKCIIGTDYPKPLTQVRMPSEMQKTGTANHKHKMRGNPSETVSRKKRR